MKGEVVNIRQTVDISKPHWRCVCGTVAMPLTDDTTCLCGDICEEDWEFIDPTPEGSMAPESELPLLPEEHR